MVPKEHDSPWDAHLHIWGSVGQCFQIGSSFAESLLHLTAKIHKTTKFDL